MLSITKIASVPVQIVTQTEAYNNTASAPIQLVNATEAADALKCHTISPLATDTWCNANCNHNPSFCPANICKCSPGPPPPPPKGHVCLHHEDPHKCYEACATAKFSMKGFDAFWHCEAKYNSVDATETTYQCPDGVTNIKYCKLTILEAHSYCATLSL